MTNKENTIELLLPINGRPLFTGKSLLEKIDFNQKYSQKDETNLIKKESIYAIIIALKALSSYFIELDSKGLTLTKEDFNLLIKFPLFLNETFVKNWENKKIWEKFPLKSHTLQTYDKVLAGNSPSDGYVVHNIESYEIWEYYITHVSPMNLVDIINYSTENLYEYVNNRQSKKASILETNIQDLSNVLNLDEKDRKTFYWLTSLLGDRNDAVLKVWSKVLENKNFNATDFFAVIEDALDIEEGFILSRLTAESPLVKFKLFNECSNNNQDLNLLEMGKNWSAIWSKLATDIVRFNITTNHTVNNRKMTDNIMIKNESEFLPLNKWDYLNGILAIWKNQLINDKTKILFYGVKGSGKKSLSLSLLNTLKQDIYTPSTSSNVNLLELTCHILENLENASLYMENNLETLSSFKNIHDVNCNILWNVEKIDSIPANILSGFDYVYDLSNIPFENRLEFSKEHFEDKNLAIKIAQQLKTFGGIKKASKLVKTNEDWRTIYPHVNIEKNSSSEFFTVFDYNSFNDIPELAGYKSLSDVFENILDMFEHPAKYEQLKAKVPKGFILSGNPGTGKTLFVKHVAKKTHLPLIVAHTNQLVDNLKELENVFDFARASAPCILFFDEIDTLLADPETLIGRDTKKQIILNSMLTEIDGVKSLTGVTIIGTTNHIHTISEAAVRSGRLSRIVKVNSPSLVDRKEIWKSYLSTRPTASVNYDYLATISNGFSGADISEAVNEASLYAAMSSSDCVTMEHINKAWEAIVFGTPNSLFVHEDDKLRTSIHEVGHAMTALHNKKSVSLVTIVPRQSGLGITAIMNEEGLNNYSLEELKSNVRILLGGIAAEKVYFNEYTSGGSSDLESIYKTVFRSFTKEGFSDVIGKVSDAKKENWSEKKRAAVEDEIKSLIDTLFLETEEFLKNNKQDLEKYANELLDKKTIGYERIEEWRAEIQKPSK